VSVLLPGDSKFFLTFASDGVDGKPWADKVNGSAKAFWQARNSWEPTWGQGDSRGMTVKKVSMYKVC